MSDQRIQELEQRVGELEKRLRALLTALDHKSLLPFTDVLASEIANEIAESHYRNRLESALIPVEKGST